MLIGRSWAQLRSKPRLLSHPQLHRFSDYDYDNDNDNDCVCI
ncbi:hypothetical protein [uncultured Thiodictyon sp.]|nr:hypothetical protein [uncultured Thiodictyon sp.]